MASAPAISTSTAAKLIWKEGPSSACGAISMTMAAARASARSDSARRPSSTPSVTSAAMPKLRSIGTCIPVSST